VTTPGTAAPPAALSETAVRRRPSPGRGAGRSRGRGVPYLLVGPAILIVLGVLGYPMVEMVWLSFQNYSKQNPFSTKREVSFGGLSNYTAILGNSEFWVVLERTVIITALMVGFTIAIGLLMALMMQRCSVWARYVLTFSLILVWSIPTLVSTIVFQWMFDQNFGVVNVLLGSLGHDWFATNVSGFGVIIFLVVWGAVPMVALMFYAGLTQVPKELVEAARVDGANPWQSFRSVVLPIIRPVVLIMTALSIFWDFQVFTQIWVMRGNQPNPDYFTLGIWAYNEGYSSFDFGTASTLTTITVLLLLFVTVPYLRQLIRIGDAK
jgi:N,N'-diacetylchitobiose transport system permease protein